ncbi:hypothetical protein [Kitasatospora sp. NPDC058478]|uniref:hypothetical protein n=1 Tax=unclassified Kitasatospora TaxID=2633591 RepID=UPI003646E1B4
MAKRKEQCRIDLSSLKEIPHVDRPRIERHLFRAAARSALHYDNHPPVPDIVFGGLASGAAFTILAFHSSVGTQSFAYAIASVLFLVSALFSAHAAAYFVSNGRNRFSQLLAHFAGRSYPFSLPLVMVILGLTSHSHDARPVPAIFKVGVILYDAAILAQIPLALPRWWRIRKARRRLPQANIDVVILGLLRVAGKVARSNQRNLWKNKRHVGSILREIETIAWAVEFKSPFLDLTPREDREVRAHVRIEGAKLAAVIRSHKIPLAMALDFSTFSKVEASLCQAFVAWVDKDWGGLTANAPEISVPRRWFSIWQRLWPSAVLASFAFALPMIPQIASSGASSSIRISLIVAAALSIATGGIPVADRVQDAVSKSLAWRGVGDQK